MHDIYCKLNDIDYNEIKKEGWNVNFFKRPKKRVDERIENVRNQIYKEIYMIISVLCLGSFFLKVLLFDVGAKGVVLELLIIIVSGVYYLARSIFLGVYWDEVELHDRSSKVPMSNKTIFTSVGLSLLIASSWGSIVLLTTQIVLLKVYGIL